MSHESEEVQEELSKKSYEVVLPLDKNVTLMSFPPATTEDYSSDESLEDDKEGRPICNTWNGKNYGLYVLGHTENPFLRHLKSFQVPGKVQVEFDPFCRADVNLKGEHPLTNAFVVWSAREREQLSKVESSVPTAAEVPLKRKSEPLEISLSDSEDGSDREDSSLTYNGESDTEIDSYEYIKSLKEKKRNGLSRTGETLWYDEANQAIRNLHSESISMTNYGKLQNQSKFGQKEFLFDTLSDEEKRLLVNNEPISDNN